MASKELWAGLGSALALVLGLITMAMNHVKIKLWMNKVAAHLSPYVQITIQEYGAAAERVQRSDLFVAVEAYLSDSSCALGARKLKAELGRDCKKLQASVDDEQEIMDDTFGATLWWYAGTEFPRSNVFSYSPGDEKRRFYRVAFHKKFREAVLESYLPQVFEKGRAAIAKNRHHRLFTNNPTRREARTFWSHVAFQHPATFDKLAMDPAKKEAIVDDLKAFKNGKEYYAKTGKAWKRGYLLYAPPGTGKSTMIAAIANLLEYDVYDLELTAVKNNTELRTLFVETKGKSIEDIDRSIDLTGKGKDKKAHINKSGGESDNMRTTLLPMDDEKDDEWSRLTLSGLLNFIDGLWSACGGERIIIFTTNNKDKLDPALIRRGRMDMHIEMSYCRSEAFKVLASNYLDINDQQLFEMFGDIQKLLDQVDMCPADVAEHLMRTEKRDTDACLKDLLVALKSLKNPKDHDEASGSK
jgi:AAA+ superfamily predicted ATPase